MRQSIVFVTTADSDILATVHVRSGLPNDFPPVRVSNATYYDSEQHVAELLESVRTAGVVVLRLLTGKRSLEKGFDRLVRACREKGIPLIACPGYQEWDNDLVAACSAPKHEVETVFSYLMHGGVDNLRNMLLFLSDTYLGSGYGVEPPSPLPWEGIYHPDVPKGIALEEFLTKKLVSGRPTVGLLFYRAYWASGNLGFIDALIRGIEKQGANIIPVFCFSLKHSPEDRGEVPRALRDFMMGPDGVARVDAVITTMSFSMGHLVMDGPTIATGWSVEYLEKLNVPIIQAIVSSSSEKDWESSPIGLSPIDAAMNVALPEFDGRIITVPFCFKEKSSEASAVTPGLSHYVAREDRVEFVARLAVKWAWLKLKPPRERRIAILLTNYPTKDARIGNAVGLDTPASVLNILKALKEAGYRVTDIPDTGDELIYRIIERCSNDREFLTEEQLRLAAGHVERRQYQGWYAKFPPAVRRGLGAAWGEPPGSVYRTGDRLAIPGILLGNVFLGLQPPRGFGENPVAVYHTPDLAPPHHYVAYYHWIREVFNADALVHVGKHGTLEWLPGKGVGLSGSCYPEVALGDLPLFYPFIVNNPGEGTQAKRRSHAVIVDHLIPAMTTADSYGDIARLEQLMDEYYQVQTLDPKKLPILEKMIWQLVRDAELHRDLKVEAAPDDFSGFLLSVDGYICEIKDAQIRDGLHTLGEAPEGDQLVGLLAAITRLDTGAIPSIRRAVAEALGWRYEEMLRDRGALTEGVIPGPLVDLDPASPVRSMGDVIERLEALSRKAYAALQARGFAPDCVPDVVAALLGSRDAKVEQVLHYVATQLNPAIRRTSDEIGNLLRGLDGEFVPPGPSGAPTRGMANVLPTGRNFYSVDPKTIPSPASWEVGRSLADSLLEKYLKEEGAYPEAVGIVVWGTATMRTHGDDIAEILSLLGVRPAWQQESRRITGLEVVPLKELRRPRIDVTVRISGFFRDAFPNLIHLVDQAVEMVAALDESPEDNFLIKHLREDMAHAELRPEERQGRPAALYRIFGSKPGAYGSGILHAINQGNWKDDQDLARVYTTWVGYAYTPIDPCIES